MTVRELLETNACIADIQITVRKDGKLLNQLNIGLYQGVKPPYPTKVPVSERYLGTDCIANKKDAIYIDKSVNSWDDGKDYWQVKTTRIPDRWLDLKVISWRTSDSSYGHPRASGNPGAASMQSIRIDAFAEGTDLTVPKKFIPQSEKEDDGQMSIEDWNINVTTI